MIQWLIEIKVDLPNEEKVTAQDIGIRFLVVIFNSSV